MRYIDRLGSPSILYKWLCIAETVLCSLVLLSALRNPTVQKVSSSKAFVATDMTGEVRYFSEPPKRILFAANIMPAFAILAQGTSRIAASTPLGRSGMKRVLLDKIYTNLDTIPSVSARLDPERILEIKPDAIFAWNDEVDDVATIPGFENVIKFRSDSSINTDFELWSSLGQVSATDERAASIRGGAEIKLEEWRRSSLDIDPKIRVLILVSGIERLWFGPKRHFLNGRLALAGAINVVPFESRAIFDLEEVLKLDPQLILISTAFNNLTPLDLYKRRDWQAIGAVRRHQVYLLPDFPSFAAPVFDPLLIEWMTELFYPETPRSIRQSVRSAYQNVFGYVCTDADIDGIIRLEANRDSAFYEKFLPN